MIDRADGARSPAMRSPKERLAPTVARARGLGLELRPVPPIEAIQISRADCHYFGADTARTIRISLPRVKFLERPER